MLEGRLAQLFNEKLPLCFQSTPQALSRFLFSVFLFRVIAYLSTNVAELRAPSRILFVGEVAREGTDAFKNRSSPSQPSIQPYNQLAQTFICKGKSRGVPDGIDLF